MALALVCHPNSSCAPGMRIEAEVARPQPAQLLLQYRITGKIGDLRMPPVTASARGDELWLHTCFEAFVRAPPSTAYTELNFAPSTRWSAYRFGSYRNSMSVESNVDTPRIEVQSTGTCYQLQAALELDRVPHLPSNALWVLAVAVVVEEMSGGKSYWALAHPPGEADFHHPDCFTYELAAP